MQGRSDHASFRSHGIPTTGIFSGAEGIMTSAQAQKWGGQAGRAYDPCYHRACDTTSNLSTTALDRNLDAIGHMIWLYADEDYGSTTTPPTTPPTGTNLLLNPGFESGAASWTGTPVRSPAAPRAPRARVRGRPGWGATAAPAARTSRSR